MDTETLHRETDSGGVGVLDADWTLIFTPASRGCPDVLNAIPLVEVGRHNICTGKMHGVWAALEAQTMPMIHCEPVNRDFLMRVMSFMGTWYKANISGMFTPIKSSERERISARRLAGLMCEKESQVAYALRLLAVDEAVCMIQINGRTEFAFNKLFI